MVASQLTLFAMLLTPVMSFAVGASVWLLMVTRRRSQQSPQHS